MRASSMPTSVELNPQESDVFSACATIHTESIPDGFLPSLGQRFLALLYRFFASNDKTFLLVARRDSHVLGFFCGSLGTGGVYKSFLRQHAAVAVWTLLPVLINPRVVWRIIETLRYPDRTETLNLPDAEILNFCVASNARGEGVGLRLFDEGIAEFQRHGVKKIRIITGEKQHRAQALYERAGAQRQEQLNIHSGEVSLAYIFDIDPPEEL